jgi:hypothetical protein
MCPIRAPTCVAFPQNAAVTTVQLPTAPDRRGGSRVGTVLRIGIVVVAVVAALALRGGGGLWPTKADPDDPTAYAFGRTNQRTHQPITWDPCLPISLVVNHAAAPDGADALLTEAAARVSEATGLRLLVAGSTTDPPDYDRTQRELRNVRPGAGRAPVLVAWTTPTDVPPLKGSIIGRGGPVIQLGSPLDQEKYIGGTVYLDGPQMASLLGRPDGHARARAVVMHELSHLVGLDHVENTAQIMHPNNSKVTEFGKGDRAGLRLLGGGGCPYATGS